MPRIISGRLGGLRLQAPPGLNTRPTADKLKEALFSSLSCHCPLVGAKVLDLYAGSGQLGIEALSRGAQQATFVERDASALRSLRHNLAHARLEAEAQIRPQSVATALQALVQAGETFDLIFADPPYKEADAALLRLAPLLASLLQSGGILLWERSSDSPLPPLPTGLEVYKTCVQGASMVVWIVTISERS